MTTSAHVANLMEEAELGVAQARAIGYETGYEDFMKWEAMNPFMYDYELGMAWFEGFEAAVREIREDKAS